MVMVYHATMQGLRAAALVLGLLVTALSGPLAAKDSAFSAAARVNGRVITRFELDQRIALMSAFRQPGDLPQLAMQGLIEDALRREAAATLAVTVAPEEVQAGLTEFAARGKLTPEQFMDELDKAGVFPETMRDFVEAGLLWRAAVRARYSDRTRITEAEVDRAIGAGAASGGDLRLLLSEIVLPLETTPDALALAQRIRLTATNARTFSTAARNFSKAPTAGNGGQLGWLDVAALPPELAPSILALKVGEMTAPLTLGDTVQIFFLRDLSQGKGEAKGAAQVDYIRFFAPAGLDLAALAPALDRCDDVYGLARGLAPEAVQRATLAEAGLPGDLRAALSRLDPGETALLPGVGGAASLVMVCSRMPASQVPPSRDEVRGALLNDRLGLLATAYLEELRANAIITLE
jgi:peptidyl-prolyl cis-trans isomerase SurA